MTARELFNQLEALGVADLPLREEAVCCQYGHRVVRAVVEAEYVMLEYDASAPPEP